ncbi:cytochrome P450 [Cercophora newfieldiana]|uniref:Cytochrome P450 n=1 Tax=Cercophora newfieldiana TaxID=92897 RepID=A0AA40CLD7_9PEZI|nr:cytochrome P450 [Cercophora newfieldiana]
MDSVPHLLASLHRDSSFQFLAGATAGLLSHALYFVRGYHDTSILSILLVHSAAYTTITTSFGLSSATLIFASYLLTLFTSISLYRLFFHPLRHFSGPLPAKLTKLYGPYLARNGQLHIEQNKLFSQYGNIVRIAPNELLILSSAAIPAIHAAKSGCRKRNAGVYNVVHYNGAYNLDSILDREEHRWRRQVWERAMTTKALTVYEQSTREICHTWLSQLAGFSSKGTAVDTSLFSLLITFDHMGKIGFSHDFKTIEAGKENRMLDLLEVMFGQLGQLGELAWPVALMKSLGVGGDAGEFEGLTREMADRREARGEENGADDIFGHFLQDFQAEKPVAFFDRNILYSDASLILVGATDTIAVVLSYAFYHLAKHQEYQEKLFSEVKTVFGKTIPGEFTSSDLSKLELLEAIINETMRLDNPVANNAGRTTPPEGIMVDGTWIPGGVAVRVPGYAMHRSELAFVRPEEFVPERWTSEPGLILDRSAFFPFLAGPNNCVGKRLAMVVLRLVLSYTVYNYRFRFALGEDGLAIYGEAKDNLILKAGPLKVVFDKRV